MEIKEGMYVRTRDGEIGQITKCWCSNPEIDKWKFYLDIDSWKDFYCDNFYIVDDPSFNILDLVKPGDYVNGYKVLGTNLKLFWWDDELGEQDEFEGIELEGYGYVYPNSNHHFEIEDILTKEQFAAMAYEVKHDQTN